MFVRLGYRLFPRIHIASSVSESKSPAINAFAANLMYVLKHFLELEEAKSTSRQLGVPIDGIWVRAALGAELIESKAAISEREYAMSKFLPNDEIRAAKHKKARSKMETIAAIALGSKAFKEKSVSVPRE